MSDSRKRLADGAFLLVLMIYILAGIQVVPVHGDEYMQMAMARDVFYMVRGEWDRLAFNPPVEPDTEQHLRLINGTLNKTLIGFTWIVSGREQLPGIFAWAMPLEWNQEQGNIPTDSDLHTARIPSALLTALGVIPVFFLGWQLRLRSLAYPAAMLYALHPVILLNGRRAMMEGSLMLTILLVMYWLISLIIAEHSATAQGFMRRLPFGVRYLILGILVGLAIAAKHTGIVVAGTALLTVILTGLMRDRSWRPFAWSAFTGIIALITIFALSPAYWRDPVGAFRATIDERAALLERQTGQAAYHSIGERLQAMITAPFLTPPQYYEAPTWAGLPQLNEQISGYQRTSVDGWDWGVIIGVVLTGLALIGFGALIYDAWRRDLVAWAILIWTGATLAASVVIPFSWQRYYLPLLLVGIILAAMGMGRLLVRRTVTTLVPVVE